MTHILLKENETDSETKIRPIDIATFSKVFYFSGPKQDLQLEYFCTSGPLLNLYPKLYRCVCVYLLFIKFSEGEVTKCLSHKCNLIL